MKNKYKFKRRKKSVSTFAIIAICLIIIVCLSISYSLWETNLTINGTVINKIFQPGTTNAGGMDITLDSDGVITLNGTVSSIGYFVKISNGLSVSTSGTASTIFPQWFNEVSNPLAVTNYQVRNSVEYLSGSWSTNKQLNVVVRDSTNTAILNCRLSSDIYTLDTTLTANAMVYYLYLEDGLSCNNLQIKPTFEITSIPQQSSYVEQDLHLVEDTITYAGMTFTVTNDGRISINGTATSKIFLKLSDSLATATQTFPSTWCQNGTTIVNTSDIMKFETSIISGSITSTGKQVNCCLRTTANVAHSVLKLANNTTELNDVSVTNTINVFYIFMDPGAQCDNLVIEPHLSIQVAE